MRPVWQEKKQKRVRLEKELSLEIFMHSGFDIPAEESSVDEIIEDKMFSDELYSLLAVILTGDERRLIDSLYYQEKSERRLSVEIDLPQITINYRKNKILKLLSKKLVDI